MQWFGKRHKKAASSHQAPSHGKQPGEQYDPELIDHFKSHHQALRKLAVDILKEANQDGFMQLEKRLREFADLFERHNAQENVRFYAYLSRQLSKEKDRDYLVGMKDEMRKIGHTVRHFLLKYLDSGIDDKNIEEFRTELKTILNVFDGRVEQEETQLFKLYRRALS